MSSTYSCVTLLQATDAEKKEAWDQLKSAAKKYAAQKKFTTTWKIIAPKNKRSMENYDFTLCQRCVVEHIDD